jgi:hypothetical protein
MYQKLQLFQYYLDFLGVTNFLVLYCDVERRVLHMHTHLLDGDYVLAGFTGCEADTYVA